MKRTRFAFEVVDTCPEQLESLPLKSNIFTYNTSAKKIN